MRGPGIILNKAYTNSVHSARPRRPLRGGDPPRPVPRRAGAGRRGGALVLVDDQDRSLPGRSRIEEGRRLLEAALALGGGPYVLRAAIADLHLREPRDREEIALL